MKKIVLVACVCIMVFWEYSTLWACACSVTLKNMGVDSAKTVVVVITTIRGDTCQVPTADLAPGEERLLTNLVCGLPATPSDLLYAKSNRGNPDLNLAVQFFCSPTLTSWGLIVLGTLLLLTLTYVYFRRRKVVRSG